MSITSLPIEVQAQICERLDAYSLMNMAQTCTAWRGFCVSRESSDPDFWRKAFAAKYPACGIPEKVSPKVYFIMYIKSDSIMKNYSYFFFDAFGGADNFTALPTRHEDEPMTAPVMRTHRYNNQARRELFGVDVRIKDKEMFRQGVVSIQERHYKGPFNQYVEWVAYSSPELGVYLFARDPNGYKLNSLPDFSIDVHQTAESLKNMLNKTDPRFVIV